ncbi:MAG: hypothetical protein ACTSWN_10655 [Promethearchaeota archaeon]
MNDEKIQKMADLFSFSRRVKIADLVELLGMSRPDVLTLLKNAGNAIPKYQIEWDDIILPEP